MRKVLLTALVVVFVLSLSGIALVSRTTFGH